MRLNKLINARSWGIKIGIGLFWLAVWQVASQVVGTGLLLPGPWEVAVSLVDLLTNSKSYASIGYSLLHIGQGFFIGFFLGVMTASLSHASQLVRTLLDPALNFIKSVPIVCIIVLLLIWFGAQGVSVISVELVIAPATYFAALEGMENTNSKRSEMLTSFGNRSWRRFLVDTWPSLQPYLLASSRMTTGLAWKSGVAAEVIGLPQGSIGDAVYVTKVTLETGDLFAWIIVIVVISALCEKLFIFFLGKTRVWSRKVGISFKSPRVCDIPEDIVVTDLNVSYKGVHLISEFSQRFQAKETYRIEGPSGSGKTSFLRVISGLQTPDAGKIKGATAFSWVFQDTRLFEDANAVDNILLAVPGCSYAVAKEVLEYLLGEAYERPVAQLSGGQRRRVELARALVSSSQVLILDEAFTGLDSSAKEKCFQAVDAYRKGRTVLLATHDDREATSISAHSVSLTGRK